MNKMGKGVKIWIQMENKTAKKNNNLNIMALQPSETQVTWHHEESIQRVRVRKE